MSDENVIVGIDFIEGAVQFILDTLEEEIGREGVADVVKDHLEKAKAHLEISHAIMVLKASKREIEEKGEIRWQKRTSTMLQ